MRAVTLGQLRGIGQLSTGTTAILVVGALFALTGAFVWGMQRTLTG
jgi:hypothetical protein